MPKCFKKITALFLAGVIALSFAACSSGGESEEDTTVSTQPADTPKSDTPLRISYTKSDSLNPYKAETQNNIVIADLVFDTLFRLDETFSPILELASSYEFTDATTLNVTYRSGAVFSDGSALQSGDILASFEAAKDSPIYSGTLSGIRSASAGAGSTIVFELAYANPNAASLLTFPILKASEIDSDLPLGSGRYAFDEDDSGNITLVQNTKKENFEPFIQSIRLVNIASSESIANGISIDNIDYAFFSLDDEDAKSIKSQTKQVNINNLVYLGFNTASSSIMSNAALRQAVSLAISRDTIAKSAYHGYALAATSIFNPACTLAEVSAIFAEDSNASAAQQAITQNGADLNKNTVRLIVNRENASRTAAATVIETALEAVGFTVDVRQLSYSDYTQALEKGQYELYLGETKLSDDMCLYPFFQKDGALHYGINENGASAKAYASYMGGSEIETFVSEFASEMPFVPLVYRRGIIGYSKDLHGDMQGIYKNYFSNIEEWYFED